MYAEMDGWMDQQEIYLYLPTSLSTYLPTLQHGLTTTATILRQSHYIYIQRGEGMNGDGGGVVAVVPKALPD